MQGHWNNAAPYYRCVFPTEYGLANQVEHPATSPYGRTPSCPLDTWLATKFDAPPPDRHHRALPPPHRTPPTMARKRPSEVRHEIADADAKLDRLPGRSRSRAPTPP